MDTYTVEHLLGVGSFTCNLEVPAQGFFLLSSDDKTFSLMLLDTLHWFSDYEISEIMEEVNNWMAGSRISVTTTITSQDGDLQSAVTNLTGPLIIDWDSKRIRQFVLHSGQYPLRAPLFQKGGTD